MPAAAPSPTCPRWQRAAPAAGARSTSPSRTPWRPRAGGRSRSTSCRRRTAPLRISPSTRCGSRREPRPTAGPSHRGRVARVEEALRVVAELQQAALSAEDVLPPILSVDEPVLTCGLDVDLHPADGVFVRIDRANVLHVCIVARSQDPVSHRRQPAPQRTARTSAAGADGDTMDEFISPPAPVRAGLSAEALRQPQSAPARWARVGLLGIGVAAIIAAAMLAFGFGASPAGTLAAGTTGDGSAAVQSLNGFGG